MRDRRSGAICGLVIALFMSIIDAEALADIDLYSGEVVVASQAEEDRNEAVPEAFIRVLQKLSGQREMPNSPALETALDDANRLLVSFHYNSEDRVGADGETKLEIWLVARFLPSEVDAVMTQIGLRRWNRERPAVQIWAVLDDGQNRRLKPLEYEYAWGAMENIAAIRGLPVSWPELDDEEIQLIDMRLVWGGFTDYLVEKGAPADGVLIVAARREGTQWALRWNLASSGQHWSWRNSDRELLFALAAGVHQMTDQIASANAIAATEQGLWTIDVIIAELINANDYVLCLAYLQSQSLITAVDILGAEPGQVHFRLQLNAAPEYVAEAFRQGSVLLPLDPGNDLEYRFLR